MLTATVRAGCVLTAVLAVLAGCAKAPPPAPPAAAAAQADPWPEFSQRFIEQYFKANPFFAVAAGRHEFDGQMPDLSAAGLDAEIGRLKARRAEAAGFDGAALTESERFEREHVYAVLDGDLYEVDRARLPYTNPAWYIEQLDPDVYLNRPYAPLEVRLKAYIAYARTIPGIAAAIRANLHTPLPQVFVARAIDGFGGFASFYRHDVKAAFARVNDPGLQKELAAADEAAARAMDELTQWLKAGRSHAPAEGYALGEALFLDMLRSTEQVSLSIDELLALGRKDLERNTQALREACARYLPKASLAACVDKMNADKAPGGVLDGARAQLKELRAFVVAQNLVTIPGDEQAEVAEAPPYNRANAAYINVPGPYDHGVPSVYTLSPPDPAWSARERAAYIPGRASLLYTSVHEVWPGHFLQFLHANRSPSRITALWVGYAYAEGWAHYCEQMMWDAGLGNGDPEQHVGQLVNALERDVRFLSAIGLHTRGMTVAESERMFREAAYMDPGDSRQQAARGTYDAEYLKYTLGKLMIMKLREDWIAAQGSTPGADPRAAWHAFHDRFLAVTGPIPLVRRQLVGEGGSLF